MTKCKGSILYHVYLDCLQLLLVVRHSLQLHTASVIFPVLTFGLFLCRPNFQTHREGLVQLNVFLQIPEYSLTTRSVDPFSIYLGLCFCFKNFPMSSFHLNNISCCRLAVHPNASELVNTSKITKIETITIGAIVTFVNNESVQVQPYFTPA